MGKDLNCVGLEDSSSAVEPLCLNAAIGKQVDYMEHGKNTTFCNVGSDWDFDDELFLYLLNSNEHQHLLKRKL